MANKFFYSFFFDTFHFLTGSELVNVTFALVMLQRRWRREERRRTSKLQEQPCPSNRRCSLFIDSDFAQECSDDVAASKASDTSRRKQKIRSIEHQIAILNQNRPIRQPDHDSSVAEKGNAHADMMRATILSPSFQLHRALFVANIPENGRAEAISSHGSESKLSFQRSQRQQIQRPRRCHAESNRVPARGNYRAGQYKGLFLYRRKGKGKFCPGWKRDCG